MCRLASAGFHSELNGGVGVGGGGGRTDVACSAGIKRPGINTSLLYLTFQRKLLPAIARNRGTVLLFFHLHTLAICKVTFKNRTD